MPGRSGTTGRYVKPTAATTPGTARSLTISVGSASGGGLKARSGDRVAARNREYALAVRRAPAAAVRTKAAANPATSASATHAAVLRRNSATSSSRYMAPLGDCG